MLVEHFRNTTIFERSQVMAYKRTSPRRKVSGVKTTVRSRRASNGRGTVRVKVWATSEISKLRKCYRNTTNGEIAKILGRSVASVRAKAGALSLKKNKNFLSICAKSAGNGGLRKAPKRVTRQRRSVSRVGSSRRVRRSGVRRPVRRRSSRR